MAHFPPRIHASRRLTRAVASQTDTGRTDESQETAMFQGMLSLPGHGGIADDQDVRWTDDHGAPTLMIPGLDHPDSPPAGQLDGCVCVCMYSDVLLYVFCSRMWIFFSRVVCACAPI
jgi:hypothetical protein